jgi:hypothetical protein
VGIGVMSTTGIEGGPCDAARSGWAFKEIGVKSMLLEERRHEGSSPAPCRWVAKAALLDLVTGAEEVDGEAYAVGPWTFDIDAGALRRGLRAMVMEITRRRAGPDRRLLASVADN